MFLICLCSFLIFVTLIFGQTAQKKLLSPDSSVRFVVGKKTIVFFVVILVLTSTVRHGFIDTYAYKIMYESSRNNLHYVNSAPWGVEAGWLYVLYYLNFLSSDPKLMLFVVALIINAAYAKVCVEYSEDTVLSLFIYFCLNFLDTNNGVRQCFSAGIIIFAFSLLKQKKYIRYILCIWVASLFHESAIVMLLFAFVSLGKPFNIKVVLTLLAGIVFLFFPEAISSFLGETVIDNKYNMYLDNNIGMGILRCFIVGVFPLLLALLFYLKCKLNKKEMSRETSLLFNLLIINAVLYLMGMYMQYWARLAFYTSFAPIVLMPKLIREVFENKSYRTIKVVAIILYFIFFAYNVYVNIGYGAMKDFYIDL